MKYKTVICGGTFDRLHDGHKYFLRKTFAIGDRVLIGLTSDTYAHQKGANMLPFQERLEELKTFLADEKLLIRAEIFPIQDIYGKAIDASIEVDAIIVSEATKHGGEEINVKRQELGLSQLPIVSISLFTMNDTVLSSTHVREGQIGRQGEIYLDEKWTKHSLALPFSLREVLHKPFGTLLPGSFPQELLADPHHTVVVGDATAKRFNEEHVGQILSVIDFSIERKPLFHSIAELKFSGDENLLEVINPSGHITAGVWEILHRALKESKEKRVIVRVNGEEDLLVIPLVLLLPLGWKLFYGQPQEGVVYLPITEEVKEKVYAFLIQFVRE